MNQTELLEKFRKEICERSKEIDEDSQQDWYSLSLGFFLACGATPQQAHELSIEVRYKHKYWCD